THTNRNALPFLATGAHAVIEPQVVADQRHASEHIGAVADERGAFQRSAEAPVLDRVGFARREYELAGGDVHLPAAEVDGVDAALDRADDLLRIVRPRAHVGVGHA